MSFSITILGSSSAIPTHRRHLSAQVVKILGQVFLLDCGGGTQFQMKRFKIKYTKIEHIFITHLHGDHFLGLFGYLSTLNLLGRRKPVHIYSDIKLQEILEKYWELEGVQPKFKIVFHFLQYSRMEVIFEDRNVIVSSFPLKHSVPTCGFLFQEKRKMRNVIKEKIELYKISNAEIKRIKRGENFITAEGHIVPNEEITTELHPPRSYAYCTDTAYSEEVVKIVKGVNLLYHEATFMNKEKKLANSILHSTSLEAATLAKKAEAKKLLIGHFSARYRNSDLEKLLKEAQMVFPNTVAVADGDVYEMFN